MLPFIIIFFLLPTIVDSTTSNTWNYADIGPDVWGDKFPLCKGHLQSPINILTACTTYQSFAPFRFSSAFNSINDFTLLNNGHTITGTYKGDNPSSLKLVGGGLEDGTFVFDNFHLHWGENYKSGSEHQVNGVKSAGEIHFVFKNPETGRTAVLAIFMKSTQDPNIEERFSNDEDLTLEEWKKYFAVAGRLRNTKDSTVFRSNLAVLMNTQLNDFWRYEGSLTVPPCTEHLIWTLFRSSILFTESELETFRKNVFFADFRSPQPLYDRVVYRSFPNEILSLIPDYNSCPTKSTRLRF